MASLTIFISSLQKKELIFSCKYMYKALQRNTFPSSLVCIFFFPVHNYHQVLKIFQWLRSHPISDDQSFIKHSKNDVLLVLSWCCYLTLHSNDGRTGKQWSGKDFKSRSSELFKYPAFPWKEWEKHDKYGRVACILVNIQTRNLPKYKLEHYSYTSLLGMKMLSYLCLSISASLSTSSIFLSW